MDKVASRYTQKKHTGKHVDLEFESWQRGNCGHLFTYVLIDGEKILNLILSGRAYLPITPSTAGARNMMPSFVLPKNRAVKRGCRSGVILNLQINF
jgi:hypothetical protein